MVEEVVETPKQVEYKKTSRTIELILGVLGGIFGLIGGIIALMISIFVTDLAILGISAILASIVGLGGAVFILKNAKWGGIILLISAVWLLISISLFGVLGAVLLGFSGVLAILRK